MHALHKPCVLGLEGFVDVHFVFAILDASEGSEDRTSEGVWLKSSSNLRLQPTPHVRVLVQYTLHGRPPSQQVRG